MVNIYYFSRPDLKDVHMIAGINEIKNYTFKSGLKVRISDAPSSATKLNICIDTGHCLPPPPKREFINTSAFWCQHCHTEKHQNFAKNFKFKFGADKHYVNSGLFNFWLPNGVGPSGFDLNLKVPVIYDVGFIGQYLGARSSALSRIQKMCLENNWSYNFIDTRLGATGKEGPDRIRPNWKNKSAFTKALKQCKILLNITGHPRKQLLNCRIFEGMLLGRPVVSDTVGFAMDVVKNDFGVVYYDYNNLDTIIPCIKRLLEDDVYYKKVVSNGLSIVNKHTIVNRILDIMKTLGINV